MLKVAHLARMAIGVAACRFLGARRPLNVMLAVTNRCTGHCRYCDIPVRSGPDMPLADVCRLIDEAAAAGAVRLGLWGGEPLIREDIGRIVSRAKARGMYVTLDSNGSLWRERESEMGDLDHVIFGVDGREENHDANRGKGSFRKVMEAVEAASARPGLAVWTITVLNRLNLGDIDYLLDLADRHRVRCTFQILHHNEYLGRNHDALMPSNDEYRAAFRLLLARKRAGARIGSSARYLEFMARWPDYRVSTAARAVGGGPPCRAGRCYCNIDADGRVYACSLLIGKVRALNALESGFEAAFHAIPDLPCGACTAGCFTEYNHIYNLDPWCVWDWVKAMRG